MINSRHLWGWIKRGAFERFLFFTHSTSVIFELFARNMYSYFTSVSEMGFLNSEFGINILCIYFVQVMSLPKYCLL